jgi:hypothetical protein
VVGDAWTSDGGAADLRVEVAMEGVTAHMDGRWQEPKVAPILVRRLAPAAEEPTLGAVLARRDVCVLGGAEDLAVRIKQVSRDAGWEGIPVGEILGDGAAWIWKVADAHVPGVRQTLDYDPVGTVDSPWPERAYQDLRTSLLNRPILSSRVPHHVASAAHGGSSSARS